MEKKQADKVVEMLDEIADGLARVVDAMPYYDPDKDGSAFIGISNGLHRIGAALEACAEQQARQNEVLRDIQLAMPKG